MKNLSVVPVKLPGIKPTREALPPPAGCNAEAAKLWRATVHQFVLEPPALVVLGSICEALTLKRKAQRHVTTHGPLVKDRFGQWRANPALAIIRDADSAMARGFRSLKLDLEPVGPIGRPSGN